MNNPPKPVRPGRLKHWSRVPASYLEYYGNLGLVGIWGVANRWGVQADASRVAQLSHYSKRDGLHAIGMAVCFARLGFEVIFLSEEDPAPTRKEVQLYRQAAHCGIEVRRDSSIPLLLRLVRKGYSCVVLYEGAEGLGTFSPLTGKSSDGRLRLPYDGDGNARCEMEAFDRAWSRPGFCRQAVVVRCGRT